MLIQLLTCLFIFLPLLLGVAFLTVGERKAMGSMQRRVGPNAIGYFGLLQAFADAIKLVIKENVIPLNSNKFLFFLGPIITLIFSLLGWAVIPVTTGIVIFDYKYSILFTLAISSVSVYGILIAGWAANSKYAFLGSMRSTSQLISYELVLSTCITIFIALNQSFDYSAIVYNQRGVILALPLLPILLIFMIASLAETNRPPFDLPEAESELVSGFNTEHSSTIFVFFFLAEYSNLLFFSTLTSLYLFGGYNFPVIISDLFIYILTNIQIWTSSSLAYLNVLSLLSNRMVLILESVSLAFKTVAVAFTFILIRATMPRIRFDQLIQLCWVYILPVLFGIFTLIIILPLAVLNF